VNSCLLTEHFWATNILFNSYILYNLSTKAENRISTEALSKTLSITAQRLEKSINGKGQRNNILSSKQVKLFLIFNAVFFNLLRFTASYKINKIGGILICQNDNLRRSDKKTVIIWLISILAAPWHLLTASVLGITA